MKPELIAEFELLVSCYQIAVSDRALQQPFNDWRREHVKQGFSWRPRSVSFSTIDSIRARIEVWTSWEAIVQAKAIRAIKVPFTIMSDSKLEVGVVGDQRPFPMPPGEYALLYENGYLEAKKRMWCKFTFVEDDNPMPAVLLADSELVPPSPLMMHADPL